MIEKEYSMTKPIKMFVRKYEDGTESIEEIFLPDDSVITKQDDTIDYGPCRNFIGSDLEIYYDGVKEDRSSKLVNILKDENKTKMFGRPIFVLCYDYKDQGERAFDYSDE
jgi:hypothetical protein